MYEREGDTTTDIEQENLGPHHADHDVVASKNGNGTRNAAVRDDEEGESNTGLNSISAESGGDLVDSPSICLNSSIDDSLKALETIWCELSVNSKKGRLDVIQRTRELIISSLGEMIQQRKKAHYEWSRIQQEFDLANECILMKTREIERFKAIDVKNRENISKLLHTLASTNEATKEHSQAQVLEARLRSDLLQVTNSREEVKKELTKVENRCKLLERDLAETKSELAQERQSKKQMKRDHQAAKSSLATALHAGGNQSNVDFYKRKVTELNAHVQGLSGILAERNKEIQLLGREKDRLLTQNQQSSLRIKEKRGTKRHRK